MNTHEFAVYCKNVLVAGCRDEHRFTINDNTVIHRIMRVLRLKERDTLIVFDAQHHALCSIQALHEKAAELVVERCVANVVYQPTLTVQLGLLKRESLQEAVSLLSCLGVTAIELFLSAKVQRSWDGSREYDRLSRCMVAAAEQSKCFSLPSLHEPIPFGQLIARTNGVKLACDVNGTSLIKVLDNPVQQNIPITILVGPEGDFTEQELELITKNGYQLCKLTPTILRAEQAATLSAGIVRSCEII